MRTYPEYLIYRSASDGPLVAAARDWIADCQWADVDDDSVAALDSVAVMRGIARHYDGGISQFRADLAA